MNQTCWRTCWPFGFMSRHTTEVRRKKKHMHTAWQKHLACTNRTPHTCNHRKTDNGLRNLLFYFNYFFLICNPSPRHWIANRQMDGRKTSGSRVCFFFFFFTQLCMWYSCPHSCVSSGSLNPDPEWNCFVKYVCFCSYNCPCKCQYLTFTRWHAVNISHFIVYKWNTICAYINH